MARFRRYYVWIDGKIDVPPHRLHEAIEATGITGAATGREFGHWQTALAYLRECMVLGFICRVYEVEE